MKSMHIYLDLCPDEATLTTEALKVTTHDEVEQNSGLG